MKIQYLHHISPTNLNTINTINVMNTINTLNTIRTPRNNYSSLKLTFNKQNGNNKKQKKSNLKLNLQSNEEKDVEIFSFDEEYVSKLKYYSPEINIKKKYRKRETIFSINASNDFPSIFKKYQMIDSKTIEETKRKLMSKINVKKNLFEKTIFDELEHTRYVGRLENMYKENTLEKRRHELEVKIRKIKDLMKPLSNELSDTLNQIESYKIDLEILKNYKNYSLLKNNAKKYRDSIRSSKIILNLFDENKNNDTSYNNNDISNENRNKNLKKLKKEMTFNNKLLMEKIKNRKKSLIEEKKVNTIEKLTMLSNKKNNILIKLDSCERDLKEFKERLTVIKNDLLIHYHKLLLEGKDTRKDGLSWIIKSIWNLKSNVIMSFMPKFLDVNSISFLFLYSNKLVEIEKIQKIIERTNEGIKKKEKKSQKLAQLTKIFLKVNHRESYYMNNNENNENNKNNKNNEINIFNTVNKDKDKDEVKCEEKNKDNNKLSDNDKSNKKNNKERKNNNNIIINDRNTNNILQKKLTLALIPQVDNSINEKKIRRLLSQPDVTTLKQSNLDAKNEEKQSNTIYSNFNLNLDETFKTSLYRTNSLSRDKSEKSISSEKNKKTKKSHRISSNLKKILFYPEYLDQLTSHISPKKIIKVRDYENFKNFRIEDSFDKELLHLFNINKEMMKKLKKLKNEAETLIRNELDRVGKCFYLEDYEAKFNTSLKMVIGALIGEDNIRNELLRQEKEQKDYFKTIKSIRNFNSFYYKKCT